MIKLKRILFFLIITGLCFGFCNPLYSQDNTIRIWVMYDKNIKNALDEAIRLFNGTHTNQINIVYRIIPWEDAYEIFKDIGSFNGEVERTGNPPDIIQVPSTWSAHLIHEGLLYGLTNLNWINQALYVQQVWNTCVSNNRIYAIPWFIDVRVLYYRRDIFERLNLSENDIRSWGSFESTADKIQRSRIKLGTEVIQSTGEKVFLQNGKRTLKPLGITASIDKEWNAIHNVIAPHYWESTGGQDVPFL